ncbi:hypothetical protein Y032_0029g1913 [Ancylostoma ceylanicum]|uniref:Uncharacterized protein n=1 Tax=Ancylostoma ceylanicum TaxID=53326 RepID=A0A016UR13_9BILA|nr:hypothetical protein Y032_0029g1913 [Ancylostoma ceylanicum]
MVSDSKRGGLCNSFVLNTIGLLPLSSSTTQTFAESKPHVIVARIAKMGGVCMSFQLLFGCYSVAVGLLLGPYRN